MQVVYKAFPKELSGTKSIKIENTTYRNTEYVSDTSTILLTFEVSNISFENIR
jgi:hypothetical protein